MNDELVEKLRETQVYYKNGKAVKRGRNPDGPAAADRIEALTAQLAEARESERAATEREAQANLDGVRAGIEASAGAMENLGFFTDIDELIGMTKQAMSERTCHEGAKAIRALSAEAIAKGGG